MISSGEVVVTPVAKDGINPPVAYSPASFLLYASPEEDLDSTETVRADRANELPIGQYRLFLEGPGLISPALFSIVRNPIASQDPTTVNAQVVPSGTLLIPGFERPARRPLVAHVLRIDSPAPRGEVAVEMSRRIALGPDPVKVTMPGGAAIVAVVDREKQSYLSLSSSINVRPGLVSQVELVSPGKGVSSLVLSLHRSQAAGLASEAEQRIELADATGNLFAADVVVPTRFQHYAIWHSVPSGQYTLLARGNRDGRAPTYIQLRPGRVERETYDLEPYRFLTILTEVPLALQQAEAGLRIREVAGNWSTEIVGVAGEIASRVLQVPPSELEVSLSIGRFRTAARADARPGKDLTVQLSLSLVEVSGTVESGGVPLDGEVELEEDGQSPQTAEIDEGGHYALLVAAGAYDVRVQMPDRQRSYWVGPAEFKRSTRYDIEVPDNSFVIRTVDASTGESLGEAEVVVALDDGSLQYSEISRTDGDGRLRLEPLRIGALRVQARKKGYQASEPKVLRVQSTDGDHEIVLSLEPEGETVQVRLRLANGSPAAHAGACMIHGSTVLGWRGEADDDGVLELPSRSAGELVVVTHSESGFSTFLAPEGALSIDLPLRAAEPLKVRVVDAKGSAVVSAAVVLWTRGVRLTGSALACATPGRGFVDSTGVFEVENAPAEPLEALFLDVARGTTTAGLSGGMDVMRSRIPYPWPSALIVEAH